MTDARIGVLGRIVEGDGRGRVVEVVDDADNAGGWLIFTYADVDRSDQDLDRWVAFRDEEFDSYFEQRTIEWLRPSSGGRTRERSTDAEVAAVSRAWIEYQADEDEALMWGSERIDALLRSGDMHRAWLVMLDICAHVEADDLGLALMIGASPLEDFIRTFGDQAMDLVEPAVTGNQTLLIALAGVWVRSAPMRTRIDRVLAAHGQERL